MIFGVAYGVWIVVLTAVVFNALVCLLMNIVAARRAYKRGYQAAQITVEAMALGRLMEQHKEVYLLGQKGVQDLDL